LASLRFFERQVVVESRKDVWLPFSLQVDDSWKNQIDLASINRKILSNFLRALLKKLKRLEIEPDFEETSQSEYVIQKGTEVYLSPTVLKHEWERIKADNALFKEFLLPEK
jgi:hypothetical protein